MASTLRGTVRVRSADPGDSPSGSASALWVNDPVTAGQRVGAGSFGWDGAYGTHFWVDPTEEIVGLVMIQTPNFQVSRDVENALMQAIVE